MREENGREREEEREKEREKNRTEERVKMVREEEKEGNGTKRRVESHGKGGEMKQTKGIEREGNRRKEG